MGLTRGQTLIQETLRQICVRNNYGSRVLIEYLNRLKENSEKVSVETGWDEAHLTKVSWDTATELQLSRVTLEKCFENSFKPYYSEGGLTRQHQEPGGPGAGR